MLLLNSPLYAAPLGILNLDIVRLPKSTSDNIAIKSRPAQGTFWRCIYSCIALNPFSFFHLMSSPTHRTTDLSVLLFCSNRSNGYANALGPPRLVVEHLLKDLDHRPSLLPHTIIQHSIIHQEWTTKDYTSLTAALDETIVRFCRLRFSYPKYTKRFFISPQR